MFFTLATHEQLQTDPFLRNMIGRYCTNRFLNINDTNRNILSRNYLDKYYEIMSTPPSSYSGLNTICNFFIERNKNKI